MTQIDLNLIKEEILNKKPSGILEIICENLENPQEPTLEMNNLMNQLVKEGKYTRRMVEGNSSSEEIPYFEPVK